MNNITSGLESVAEVKADDKGRISFGQLGVQSHSRFLVSVRPTGEILLTPLASVPEYELLVWENEQVLTSLAKGLVDYKEGRISQNDYFLNDALDE